jgi:hypothetical protein
MPLGFARSSRKAATSGDNERFSEKLDGGKRKLIVTASSRVPVRGGWPADRKGFANPPKDR